MPFTMKRGDTDPLVMRVNADVTLADLRFLIRDRPDSGTAVVVDAGITTEADGEGTIVTVPSTSFGATVGQWYVELEATQAGEVKTFPSNDYERLRVIADLG